MSFFKENSLPLPAPPLAPGLLDSLLGRVRATGHLIPEVLTGLSWGMSSLPPTVRTERECCCLSPQGLQEYPAGGELPFIMLFDEQRFDLTQAPGGTALLVEEIKQTINYRLDRIVANMVLLLAAAGKTPVFTEGEVPDLVKHALKKEFIWYGDTGIISELHRVGERVVRAIGPKIFSPLENLVIGLKKDCGIWNFLPARMQVAQDRKLFVVKLFYFPQLFQDMSCVLSLNMENTDAQPKGSVCAGKTS